MLEATVLAAAPCRRCLTQRVALGPLLVCPTHRCRDTERTALARTTTTEN